MWQALVALQPPPQVAEAFASLRNCRAETVPAQRTPMTSAVKNVVLAFLFMFVFLLCFGAKKIVGYRAGLAAMKLHVPLVNPG